MKVTNEQQKKTDATSEELVTPWDVYLHVAVSLLHWDIAFFLKASPRFWLVSYIKYLEMQNGELFEEEQVLTIDKGSFW
ncbi:hypothetical protein ACJYYY_02235 [Brochothrix campestris]|uniref:Uncharacterized protein n=1 Tax=Brochothrix campestris FSL F6-1037 TaxID=1265861 RepID=W7CQQ7_9LIST|nr:hypothetical protein BCAMP_01190 [Brochothrix campestris FSL F6-1037]